jgi:hypothetical protein
VFDARHGLHRTCGRHARLKWCGIAGSRSHFVDSMLLDLTSAILCMHLQGVLTSWKSERLLKTCADDGSCHVMVVWRARLGDISRFEPTKSTRTITTPKVRETSADGHRDGRPG